MMAKKKKRFEVEQGETIAQCLDRMNQEGYLPTRRIEKPVFVEKKVNGQITEVVDRQNIIFEGVFQENTND